MLEPRSDLAFESRNFYLRKPEGKGLSGIVSKAYTNDIYSVTSVKIESEEAAEKLGKPQGTYITIHSDYIPTGLYTKELSEALCEALTKVLPSRKNNALIFAAGLGNDQVTPDAIGPKTLDGLIVTRHLFEQSNVATDALTPLCALAPGVLGLTGIETAEVFSSVAERVRPSFIIAVDALAARSSQHVGTTIQISDTGIHPGSGVHNRRNALNRETLGVPVIVVGVPTVSDASSVVYDAVDEIIHAAGVKINASYYEKIINDVLSKRADAMMVTPKNIDAIVARCSVILSRGINLAIHTSLSYQDVTEYVS